MSEDRLPALSLHQPFAWAVVYAGKNVENRSTRTTIRGPVVIHATKHEDRAYYRWACEWMVSRGLARCPSLPDLRPRTEAAIERWERAIEIPAIDAFDRGCLYGVAKLVDVLDKWTPEQGWKMHGKHGYVLEAMQPIRRKPWHGMPGWFYVPKREIVTELDAVMGARA